MRDLLSYTSTTMNGSASSSGGSGSGTSTPAQQQQQQLLHGETTPKIHNRKPELTIHLPSALMQYADECLLLESGSSGYSRDVSGGAGSGSSNSNSGMRSSASSGALNRNGTRIMTAPAVPPTSASRQPPRRFKRGRYQKSSSSSSLSDVCTLGKLVLLIVVAWGGVRFMFSQSSVPHTIAQHQHQRQAQKESAYDRAATNITLEHMPRVNAATSSATGTDSTTDTDTLPNAFAEFPTLQATLDSSDIVALYFAAAWCPMSTPITNLLDNLFRDRLSKQGSVDNNDNLRFAILYVSSDKDQRSFHSYIKPGWHTVPFDHVDERTALKRHFRTCAKREMADVGLHTRDYEIPNLIVLSGNDVLTYSGISDIKELGVQALTHWHQMQREQPVQTTTVMPQLDVSVADEPDI